MVEIVSKRKDNAMEEKLRVFTNPYYGKSCVSTESSIRSRWATLLFLFFVIPTFLGLPFIVEMIKSGEGGYLLIFVLVFLYSLYINASIMFRIAYETEILQRCYCNLSVNTDFNDDSISIVANHVRNLKKIFNRSGDQSVNQDSLIEILHEKLKSKESIVVLFSNLMITLGLIGTVSGLITTVGGIGSDGNMEEALGGMGTAFYTTLLGSVLGGITLRILHHYVSERITLYILNLAEVVEIRVIPQFRKRQNQIGTREVAVATVSVLRDMNMIKEICDEI